MTEMTMPIDKSTNAKPKVGLLVTCLVDLYRPSVGFAAIKLLEQAGCEVDVPLAQTCCGQPAFNNGDKKDARAIAAQVIEAFAGYDYVVIPSGSCAGMIVKHYPRLFQDGADEMRLKAQGLADRSHELLSFLHDVMHFDRLKSNYKGTVTYHDSCAGLREMSVQAQPRALLAQVAGLTLTEMDDSNVCCGFGGTFCVKYPEISAHMVNEKVRHIEKNGAQMLLGGDLGCLLNITGAIKRQGKAIQVRHTAEVLANQLDSAAIGEKNG